MKKIHTLSILDRSGSMSSYKARTIESFNSDLADLREQAKTAGVKVYNTLLTFASSNNWNNTETDFNFPRVCADVATCADLTSEEYHPKGGTPLLDAIGKGIERLKTELGDELGSDDVHILVTILTDGDENSSTTYNKSDIKKMIDHFSENGKWTFTFIGCGSLENVTATSGQLGIKAGNTMAFKATEDGYNAAYCARATSFTSYIGSVTTGNSTNDLFAKKSENSTPTV